MTWESDFSEPVSSSSGRLAGSCPSRVLAGLHDKVFCDVPGVDGTSSKKQLFLPSCRVHFSGEDSDLWLIFPFSLEAAPSASPCPSLGHWALMRPQLLEGVSCTVQ